MRRLALTTLLLFVTGVGAGDFYDGLAAYKQGDDAAALLDWRPLAE